ncbi:N-acetylmuramoyl-L-alanine amidase [Synechocystis sp. LKSZ1]|uniref:N-acetylmuramoyl-L-alanine amidase n=1 Tax=Synechocystis sp. LKSZ1 TaxID=3144951 RepID=UPI00336BDEA9
MKWLVYAGSNIFVLWMTTSGAWAGSLSYWKFDVQDSRLDFVTSGQVRPKAQILANPTRLVIDLPGIQYQDATVYKPLTSYVREVRVGRLDGQTTRLVVELAAAYSLRPWEVQMRGLAPNRWSAKLPKLLSTAEYQLPNDPVEVTVPPPQALPRQRFKVVIDPGHGGYDPGAIGLGSIREKDIVLAISQGVARELERQGIGVVMTRSRDEFISLQGRVQKAEAVNATIFVSIHANSMGQGQPGVNGLETYHYSTGLPLARSIHRSILRRLNIKDRGVRRARFYVLRKTSMPATLVEVGFVTGAQDSRQLANPSYRQRMAEAIAAGIISYLQ